MKLYVKYGWDKNIKNLTGITSIQQQFHSAICSSKNGWIPGKQKFKNHIEVIIDMFLIIYPVLLLMEFYKTISS